MGCCSSSEGPPKGASRAVPGPVKTASQAGAAAAQQTTTAATTRAAPAVQQAGAAAVEAVQKTTEAVEEPVGRGIDTLREAAAPDSPSKGLSLLRAAAGTPCTFEFQSKDTEAFEGQKPGTSGLRKKTKVFMQPNYLENFVQSVFDALAEAGEKGGGHGIAQGQALVISGDGRYHNKVAIQTIIKMAVANGVTKIWVGQHGLLSTPAVSAVVRTHGGSAGSFGGFILSASHNPGGIDEDFGIKYNCQNGGPAPELITNAVAERTKTIAKYLTCTGDDIDISKLGTTTITLQKGDERKVATVEVIDNARDHVDLLKEQFSFDAIRSLVQRSNFSMIYDSMYGVQAPYAKKIFVEELGLPESCLIHAEAREDFGGKESAHHGHADPNLTHARGLVKAMGLTAAGRAAEDAGDCPDFGAAADGDADRNMICGRKWFVSPSDSLAIIADNAESIPGLRGLKGCARSMPTSGALDRVAKEKGYAFFEVPTGWKFFGNLMDSGDPAYFPGQPSYVPFLCGEESFGTGSSHIREKDGMWAALAWLQILACKNEGKADGETLVSVEDVCREHWAKYGRNYYTRYDYEGVDLAEANKMMADMKAMTEEGPEAHSTSEFTLGSCDMFSYLDPVDGSTSSNQGIRWIMADGSRIIFRLSGTGTAGATIRLYLEQYVGPSGDVGQHAAEVVLGLAKRAMELSDIPKRFAGLGTNEHGIATPTVIT